jgi:hypothetical protein
MHIREQIASALDVIVHMARLSDGRRVISHVSTVEGLRSGLVITEDLFVWNRSDDQFIATLRDSRLFGRLRERHGATGAEVEAIFEPPAMQGDVELNGPLTSANGDSIALLPEGEAMHRPHRAPRRRRRVVRRLKWEGSLRRLGTILE